MGDVTVTIIFPKMLSEAIGTGRLKVRAATVRAALDAACEKEPALKFHIFNDTGRFREHILCFHNGTNTRELKSLNIKLSEGDEISILQAISGG